MISREEIVDQLLLFANENEIRILLAVESGSRLWGMASWNSDYDVRFIYIRSQKHYLSVFNNKNETLEYLEGEFDFVGWDIRKFLRLLSNSNPTALEWLQSDIVYMGSVNQKLISDIIEINAIALYEHYRSLAHSNWSRYIDGKEEVKLKKYLYVMRGVINALYVIRYNQIPEPKIANTINSLDISRDVLDEFNKLLSRKMDIHELGIGSQIKVLNSFIISFFSQRESHHGIIRQYSYSGIERSVLDRIFHKFLENND